MKTTKGRKLDRVIMAIVDWGTGMSSPACSLESPWILFSDGYHLYRWDGGDLYDLGFTNGDEVKVTAFVRADSEEEVWQTRRLYKVKVEKI